MSFGDEGVKIFSDPLLHIFRGSSLPNPRIYAAAEIEVVKLTKLTQKIKLFRVSSVSQKDGSPPIHESPRPSHSVP